MIIRFLLVCSFAVIGGCASVNEEPFLKYRTAVEGARDGMDAAGETARLYIEKRRLTYPCQAFKENQKMLRRIPIIAYRC